MKDEHRDLLRTAVKRYDDAISGDQENRDWAINDLEFLTNTGDGQWPAEDREARTLAGRPCITVNLLSGHVRQVTAAIRQTNPAIKVVPADAEASEEMAEIKAGIIRQIEDASGATGIYERAAESAAGCGMGFWRVLTRYCDDDTFDQECVIEGLPNAFNVVCDPLAKHPTRKDARFWFIAEALDLEDFKATYPDANPAGWANDGIAVRHWATGETVTVAEYWWKETVSERIVLLDNGQVLANPPKGVPFRRERTVERPKIMWAKITAHEVLEGPQEWAGKHFPIVAVTGEEWHLGDRVVRTSVIRHAKQPQQLYNYGRSMLAEIIAAQPKAPFMVTADQVNGLESIWAQANKANVPYLVYNPDANAPGAPQRQQPPMVSQGVLQELMLAKEDVKATTGIYDASLGDRSNETSGVAIKARQVEGDRATSIYVDNLALGIEQTGRILLDLIPKIYDTERVVRVLGKDGAEKMETVNRIVMTEYGPQAINDLLTGKYDVRVTTGPAYQTLRQEAVDGMLGLAQVVGPQAALGMSDIIAENTDWPGASQASERLRKIIETAMPGVIEPEEPTPEQQQAMLAQQAQQDQAMKMQEAAFEVEMAEKAAKTRETEAKADKLSVETAAASFELAIASGQLDVAIQQAIARALQGAMAPQGQF